MTYQLVQLACPPVLYVPTPHARHAVNAVEAMDGLYNPAGQLTHDDDPVEG